MSGEAQTAGRAALVGAGAIGLSVAAAFAASGHEVVVCGARSAFDVLQVSEGAQHAPTAFWPVTHVADPSDLGRIDVLILAVKAQQTSQVAHWLRAADALGATILVAQNGVDHVDRVSPFCTTAPVVASVCTLNAERLDPGHVLVRRPGRSDLMLPEGGANEELAATLTTGGLRTTVEPDFVTIAWDKLMRNITANPITALTGRRVEVLRDPAIAEVAVRLMTEATEVGRAEGANLPDDEPLRVLHWMQNLPDDANTSMRQDRLAGRTLEHEALTGAVVRAAERHGISVPGNRMILALLGAIGGDSIGRDRS